MSSLIVEVCRVEQVLPHPNADRMSICVVKGWRVCAGKDTFRPGDRCVYVPPESVLPPELSDRAGCTKYLSPLPANNDGVRPPGGRVRVAKLRGEASYGLILPLADDTLPVGTDMAARLGITKYEPPPEAVDGDGLPAHPAFHAYTDVENYRNFPHLFALGEEVLFTEKVHGKNCRLGLVRTAAGPELMAGSHGRRRKERDAKDRVSQFWQVLSEPVRDLLRHAFKAFGGDVVLFGELYGAGVQDLWYGLENGAIAFRAFDLSVGGRYVDHDDLTALCDRFSVARVPVLYRGPFSAEAVEAQVSGPTTLCPTERAGRFKFREGIVMRPARERLAEINGRPFSRVILKAISFEYLERRGGTEHR